MESKPEVILIEDNEDDAEFILRRFSHEGLSSIIRFFKDSENAISYLQDDEPNGFQGLRLILLDIKMPKIDGFTVLKKLREESVSRNIPVVMLSSSRQEKDIQKAYALGANGFVVKPMDFDDFTECVNSVIRYWLYINKAAPGNEIINQEND